MKCSPHILLKPNFLLITLQPAYQSLTWSNQHSETTVINNLSRLYVHKVTSSLNFSSNRDWLYFPSIHVSLVMTIVMLITIPPMSVKLEKIITKKFTQSFYWYRYSIWKLGFGKYFRTVLRLFNLRDNLDVHCFH